MARPYNYSKQVFDDMFTQIRVVELEEDGEEVEFEADVDECEEDDYSDDDIE